MKVLLTGSLGYIGCIVTKKLIDAGFSVTGCDLGIFPLTSDWKKDCYEVCQHINHLKKDIRNLSSEDLKGFNAVIHLAALSNDPTGDLNPKLTEEVNFRASVRLAKLAKKTGAERFIFSSSCSVYGARGDEYITEESPVEPITPYAKSKVMAESDMKKLSDRKFTLVFLRNATVFGTSPRMRLDLVVNNMCGFAHTTGKVKILSDGTSWRPNIHVEDVANAIIAVLETPAAEVNNQVLNVGLNSENYRVKEIANIISKISGCEVEFAPGKIKDPRSYRVDFSKIKEHVKKFKPMWTVEMGAKEVLDAMKKMGFTSENFKETKYYTVKYWKNLLDERKML